ncbi:hypothetical protein ACQUSR_14115 [Streptomyces sp. P1-3]|uniref:hypothetical protein n=1 Tax=Streptomyces sp. P1-3 TaxID=3421658 RepID=UPI003D368048
MTTIQRTGRALAAAVVALFAAFLAVECLAAPPTRAAGEASAAEAATYGSHRVVQDAWGQRGEDTDCEGRRTGRAPVTVPAPSGKAGCASGWDTAAAETPAGSVVPRTPRQTTVPVSRSGELAVALQTFRC